MQRSLMPAIGLLAYTTTCFAADTAKPAEEEWKVASTSGGVTIYSRPHADKKALKEFKAIGQVEAPSAVVHAVISDFEAYPKFMPYTTECRMIKRESADTFISYQRISPKVVSDRDYALRVRVTSTPGNDGNIYSHKWQAANELGPPKKENCLRVDICEGSWLLEPDGPDKTRATYFIYSDSGGMIPAFLANHFAQTGINKVFTAVRKQAKDPKYSVAAGKPVPAPGESRN